MIKSSDHIITDQKGQEFLEYNSSIFNLSANDADLHQYTLEEIPSHWHKELEIFVLLEGHVQAGIGNHTYDLLPGDGCFINSEIIHSFSVKTSAACHFRSFVFGAEIVGGMPGTIFDTNYVRPLLENGPYFLKFGKETDSVYYEEFDRAFSACSSEKNGYEFEVRNALSNILLYINSKSTPETRSLTSVQEKRLKTMLSWIDQHLSETITVSAVADSANICTRECQRIFNHCLHYSPTTYVLRKRIYTAAELLLYTDKNITDIALSCGFLSPSYFSKRFRECIGCTPNEYRSSYKE